MYVARALWPSSNGKSYEPIYLRESYREGTHVRKRDIANLTHCDPKEVAAIELALKFKGDLSALGSLDHIRLAAEVEGRSLKLTVNQPVLDEISRLDGCYVLKTDLPASAATMQIVHDRYKDLAEVEQAFRNCKTAHLEARPIYVRTAAHTRGHVLVVMLAYLIRRDLSQAWTSLDVTVEEGLNQLQTLCSTEISVDGGGSCLRIPTPSSASLPLLKALNIQMPKLLPHTQTRVVTRKKLPQRRQVR